MSSRTDYGKGVVGEITYHASISRQARKIGAASMKTAEFDKKFDNGEDISAYVDWSKARRPNLEARRVNVDLPAWMVDRLDKEARHLGVTRQSVIKMWIAERLK